MDFYGIVIIIATCFLIICLIIMGIIMQKMDNQNPYPPVINPCPDNWLVKGNVCGIPSNNNIGNILQNKTTFLIETHGISDLTNGPTQIGTNVTAPTGGTAIVDFTHADWGKSGSSICGKKTWATNYGITWDGISNNIGC
jgi:hypothetical protein